MSHEVKHTVQDMLRNAATVYEKKNLEYGNTYKRTGAVIQEMFGEDPPLLETAEDYNRFAILAMIAGKLTRYATNFNHTGHEDSLIDISVYAQMLRELDK